ncbi:MAG: hypothetical protein IAG13_34120 [Deltaproteobacteria bacterium]|nr:hypothetical protein [Nannocystaceae bacterium]
MARSSAILLATFLATGACFKGAERDKEVPPGNPGGLCLAPDGRCDSGMCNRDENYCYDPADPCEGFFCGGEERGTCTPDGAAQPSCQCAVGYENQTFALYCCPIDGSDPYCDPSSAEVDGEQESSGG